MSRRLHKIRVIQYGGGTTTIGLSLPLELSNWLNTFVSITESGNAIILESGAKAQPISNKELLKFSVQTEFVKI